MIQEGKGGPGRRCPPDGVCRFVGEVADPPERAASTCQRHSEEPMPGDGDALAPARIDRTAPAAFSESRAMRPVFGLLRDAKACLSDLCLQTQAANLQRCAPPTLVTAEAHIRPMLSRTASSRKPLARSGHADRVQLATLLAKCNTIALGAESALNRTKECGQASPIWAPRWRTPVNLRTRTQIRRWGDLRSLANNASTLGAM
jgi:hypothetical protein